MIIIATGHYGDEGGDVKAVGDFTLQVKQAYCEEWGHILVNDEGRDRWDELLRDADGPRWNHSGFARTRAIQVLIEKELLKSEKKRASYVLYMDADAIITNPDIDVESLLSEFAPRAHFFATYDQNKLHTGTMVFKVSEWSYRILEEVWLSDKKHNVGDWWEQGALNAALERDNAINSGRAYILDKRILNAYPDWFDCYGYEGMPEWVKETYFWRPSSFILHTPAVNYPLRLEILRNCMNQVEEWRRG
jgi:hypothetical protein